jgi:DNA primase
VRQAVLALLHDPGIAAGVDAEALAGIDTLSAPGMDVLRALLGELRAQPARTTGQVLERWRGRPEGERLARLAQSEALLSDSAAAARELAEALSELRAEGVRERIDQLRHKGLEELEPEEKAELTRLIMLNSDRRSPRAAPH